MKNRSLNNQTVLITGASSGIGFATAIYFDNIGIKVYAGVRKESDGERLKEHEINNITPVILDVCDYPSIQRAFDLIKKKEEGTIFNLINNAGLSLNGPLELMDQNDIQKQCCPVKLFKMG